MLATRLIFCYHCMNEKKNATIASCDGNYFRRKKRLFFNQMNSGSFYLKFNSQIVLKKEKLWLQFILYSSYFSNLARPLKHLALFITGLICNVFKKKKNISMLVTNHIHVCNCVECYCETMTIAWVIQTKLTQFPSNCFFFFVSVEVELFILKWIMKKLKYLNKIHERPESFKVTELKEKYEN